MPKTKIAFLTIQNYQKKIEIVNINVILYIAEFTQSIMRKNKLRSHSWDVEKMAIIYISFGPIFDKTSLCNYI